MANKHKFTLAVNTVGCQEDVVTVSSESMAEASLLAMLIFSAACELRMVRGFDEFDKVTLKRMVDDVTAGNPGLSQHWRISDTQVIFVHREEF